MKVRELIGKAHLIEGQKITLEDHREWQTYRTVDRYAFELGDKTEYLLNLKVVGFSVSEDGLKVWAE